MTEERGQGGEEVREGGGKGEEKKGEGKGERRKGCDGVKTRGVKGVRGRESGLFHVIIHFLSTNPPFPPTTPRTSSVSGTESAMA